MSGRPRLFEWTSEKEEELIRRFEAGERIKVIAASFDFPPHAVDTRIDRLRREGRLRLRNRAWLPADDRAVLAGLAAGDRPRAIAQAIGRTCEAVRVRIFHLRQRQRAAQATASSPFATPPPPPAASAEVDHDQFTLELRAA